MLFLQGSSETKTAVFPVHTRTWENPLQLPPTAHTPPFGLVSRIKAVTRGGSARRPGRSLHPRNWTVSPVICVHSCLRTDHRRWRPWKQKTKPGTGNGNGQRFSLAQRRRCPNGYPHGKVLLSDITGSLNAADWASSVFLSLDTGTGSGNGSTSPELG